MLQNTSVTLCIYVFIIIYQFILHMFYTWIHIVSLLCTIKICKWAKWHRLVVGSHVELHFPNAIETAKARSWLTCTPFLHLRKTDGCSMNPTTKAGRSHMVPLCLLETCKNAGVRQTDLHVSARFLYKSQCRGVHKACEHTQNFKSYWLRTLLAIAYPHLMSSVPCSFMLQFPEVHRYVCFKNSGNYSSRNSW